jgi:hypothetical protein
MNDKPPEKPQAAASQEAQVPLVAADAAGVDLSLIQWFQTLCPSERLAWNRSFIVFQIDSQNARRHA